MRYSPAQYAEALYDLAKDAAPSRCREAVRNVLDFMKKNGALALLPEVMRELGSIFDAKNKIHAVSVWSTERLSETGIARKLPFRSRVHSTRNVRLGGGAVVEVDGFRVDNSVAGRLARARKAFTK